MLGRCAAARATASMHRSSAAHSHSHTKKASVSGVWCRQFDVSVRTEVWGLEDVGDERVHVLVIPGNPGAAAYYGAFLTALREQCREQGISARVWAVSSVGFNTLSPDTSATAQEALTLQQQIDHKAQFLAEHCLGAHDLPVVLLGHSIGAYMAHKATQQLEEGGTRRVAHVGALCPFFETTPNRTQRVLHALSGCLGSMAALGGMLERTGPAVRRVLRPLWAGGMGADAVVATEALFRRDAFQAAFGLAATEFSTLTPSDAIWAELAARSDRLSVVSGPDDKWFPDEHLRRCQQMLSRDRVVLDPSLSHGFCIDGAQSQRMARIVAPWIALAVSSEASTRAAV